MRKTNKKGFTIVELVIVIAVIAILAAVLIPTYSSLVKKANVSKDTQLIKNLNTALAADENKHNTMTDALNAAAEFGYDVAKINASATDNEILWDSVNDVFCYYDADAKTVKYISEVKNNDVKDYQYWKIYTEMPTQQTYSIYWNAESTEIAELSVGFDCGKFASDLDLKYTNSGDKKTVTFRTNGGKLTIDAANDDVIHYGSAAVVDVKAVADSSYHAHGTIGLLNLTKGHVKIEQSGKVDVLTGESSNTKVTNNGTITLSTITEKIEGTAPVMKYTEVAETLTTAGGYVKLTNNQTISEDFEITEDTVIDLNGHTINFTDDKQLKIAANVTIVDTSANADGKITGTVKCRVEDGENKGYNFVLVNKGTLTLNSGTIEATTNVSTEYPAMVCVKNGATLVVNGGKISHKKGGSNTAKYIGSAVMVVGNGTKCYVNGGVIETQANWALGGNGGEGCEGTYIEINGGKIISGNDSAIYHPQVGTLNINGGYFEGYSAIYQKAGTMTITGGVFKATGAKVNYNYNGNGGDPTGDCIIIDSCKHYGNGATVANILLDNTKITCSDAKAKAVAGYIYENNAAVIIWNGEEVTSIEVEN